MAGFVDFLCGANIVGNIISAEKICNYPGRSRVTRLVQYMDNDCETLVSTRIRDTEYFHVGVGLYQGSALNPLLFILIMDVLQA